MGWIGRLFGRDQRGAAAAGVASEFRSFEAALTSGLTWSGGAAPSLLEVVALPPVWAAIQILRDDIARLPIYLWRDTEAGPVRVLDNSAARVLASRANGSQSAFEFWRWVVTSCCTEGDAIVRIRRNGAGDLLALDPDIDRLIQAIKIPGGEVRYQTTDAAIDESELLHFRWMSLDGVTAESPVRFLRDSWATLAAMDRTAQKFFDRGARPTGILSFEGNLKADQVAALKQQYEAAMGRGSSVGGILVLDSNGKFVPMATNFEAAQFAELLAFGVQQTARVFRVAPYLLQDLSRATYSNVGEAMRAHYRMSLAPWCSMISSELNLKLFPNDDIRAEHDGDPILRGDARERYETYEIGLRSKFLTVADVREWENLPPIPEPAAETAPPADQDEQEPADAA